jgi:hypothetical protein
LSLFDLYERKLGQGGLEILDISDPGAPAHVGGYSAAGLVNAVAVDGHFAFVAEAPGGGGGHPAGGGLAVLDIADPAAPRQVGAYRLGTEISSVAVAGGFAYAYFPNDGLEVIDVSDPAHPRQTGRNSAVAPPNGVRQLTISQGRLFAAAGEQGLVILDFFHPFRLQPASLGQRGAEQLGLTGPRGLPVVVQRSADLMRWEDWQSVTLPTPPLQLGNGDAQPPDRFYRGVWKRW